MFEDQKKIEQEWRVKQFATHKAKLIQDTDRYFIAEWLIADGVPEQNSSIDQEDILRELQEQYSEEG